MKNAIIKKMLLVIETIETFGRVESRQKNYTNFDMGFQKKRHQMPN